jgi:hypothetical protein
MKINNYPKALLLLLQRNRHGPGHETGTKGPHLVFSPLAVVLMLEEPVPNYMYSICTQIYTFLVHIHIYTHVSTCSVHGWIHMDTNIHGCLPNCRLASGGEPRLNEAVQSLHNRKGPRFALFRGCPNAALRQSEKESERGTEMDQRRPDALQMHWARATPFPCLNKKTGLSSTGYMLWCQKEREKKKKKKKTVGAKLKDTSPVQVSKSRCAVPRFMECM